LGSTHEVLLMPVDAGAVVAGADNLKPIRCEGRRLFRQGGKARREIECRNPLMDVPKDWNVKLVAITSREAATGKHAVRRCKDCGGWWELRRVS
jgi:hypothetical protein